MPVMVCLAGSGSRPINTVLKNKLPFTVWECSPRLTSGLIKEHFLMGKRPGECVEVAVCLRACPSVSQHFVTEPSGLF